MSGFLQWCIFAILIHSAWNIHSTGAIHIYNIKYKYDRVRRVSGWRRNPAVSVEDLTHIHRKTDSDPLVTRERVGVCFSVGCCIYLGSSAETVGFLLNLETRRTPSYLPIQKPPPRHYVTCCTIIVIITLLYRISPEYILYSYNFLFYFIFYLIILNKILNNLTFNFCVKTCFWRFKI